MKMSNFVSQDHSILIPFWAENQPVNEYNVTRLNQISAQQYILTAIDQYPPHVSKQDIDRVLARSRSETGGLDYHISIKEGCRVMLKNICDKIDFHVPRQTY